MFITVPAPIKEADTIQKIFFEEQGAATSQERLLFKNHFLKLTLCDFKSKSTSIGILINRESVAGSVIQGTRTVEFEDGLWIGNHLKARNGLQRVRTIPGV